MIFAQCHRLLTFAEDTVEERIAATVVGRMAAMDAMAGGDASLTEDILRIIEESIARRA